MKQRLLILFLTLLFVSYGKVAAQAYHEFEETTLFYSTYENAKEEYKNGWITDGKGSDTFNNANNKKATIDPETDEEIDATTYVGLGIKGANAEKGAIMYVTGVTSFKSYIINSSSGVDRAMTITYTDGSTSANKTVIVPGNGTGVLLIEDLNPGSNYKISYASYETSDGVPTTGGGDMVLYAVKFFTASTEFIPAEITSFSVNGENVAISGTEISAIISNEYSNETVSIEFEVDPSATVLVDGASVENVDGVVTTTVATPASSQDYSIQVTTTDESRTYTLTIEKGRTPASPGTYREFTETTLFYSTIENAREEYTYGWITDGKGANVFNAITNKKATIDPETDEEIDAETFEGLGIKGANAEKGAILYVTGVTSFKSYIINSSNGVDRAMTITYTDGSTTNSQTTIVLANRSGVALIDGLNPGSNYKISYAAYETEEGVPTSGGDMVLYAVKFFTTASEFVPAEITSFSVNGENVAISGTEISAIISNEYSNETVSIEFEVDPSATVLVDGASVENVEGVVTTTVATPASSQDYSIQVTTASESQTYTLTIERGRTPANPGTYREFTETTLFYSTIANAREEYTYGWITDGKGANVFNEIANKKATIDPETDEEIDATTFEGLGIKGANAEKGAILYVTGVTSFKSYLINSSNSVDRAMTITYTDGSTTASQTTIVPGNESGVSLIQGLNPGSNYKISYAAYETEEGEPTTSGGDMVLYAVKFFTTASEFVPAEITSFSVNGENVAISGTDISASLAGDYSNETVSIEFEVDPSATVLVDGANVENVDGVVTTTVATPETSQTYEIEVTTADESRTYTLSIVKGRTPASPGTYREFTETTLFYSTFANAKEEYRYGWITDGKGANTFNEIANKKATIDPETDQEIEAETFEGLGIKGANADKGAILYVTGVASFKSYIINSSSSVDRAMVITYTDGTTTNKKTTIVKGNESGYSLINGLNPESNYKITYEAYEADDNGNATSTGGDMVVYAVKFFTEDVTFVSAAITSFKVDGETVAINNREIAATIAHDYTPATIAIEFEVDPEAEVTIDGENAENVEGTVATTVAAPATSQTYTIEVVTVDESRTYTLTVTRGVDAIQGNSIDKMAIWSENGSLEIISPERQLINIHGLDGRMIRSVELNAGQTTINGLTKGIYLINNQKVVVK